MQTFNSKHHKMELVELWAEYLRHCKERLLLQEKLVLAIQGLLHIFHSEIT